MKILLALGADPAAAPIRLALEARGWAVVVDPKARDAEAYAAGGGFDAVLLDPALPEAARTVARLRAAAPDLAILALGRAPCLALKARMFDAGADDVQGHPLAPEEIDLRARAIGRRRLGHGTGTLRFGDLVVVPGQQASVAGRRMPLTRAQFTILEFLALRAGRIVTRDALLDALYGGAEEPNAKIIDVFMTKLRGMLRLHGASPSLIGTVWGRGYIMTKPYEAGTPMPDHGAELVRHMPKGHSPRRYTAAALRAGAGHAA